MLNDLPAPGSPADKSVRGRPSGRRRISGRARRVRDHLILATISALGGLAVFSALRSKDAIFRASMATAYVAFALFAVSLALGPISQLRGRRYPVSTHLRRDVGIWAGIIAITHVIIGLQVHLRGKMWEYFVRSAKGVFLPRIDPFGAANYAGLVAALIFAALLATSNDAALRRLGVARWQRLHGLTAWALILAVLHAALYQFVEKRTPGLVVALAAISAAAIWLRFVRVKGSDTNRPY